MTVTAPAVAASGTAVANPTGQWVNVAVTGGTTQAVASSNPAVGAVTTPAVPATTVPVTNTNTFPVLVSANANGATISAVSVSSVSQSTTVLTYVIPAGGSITLTYTVATPTWTWTPLWAGVSGNPIASPYNVSIAPGGSITLTYSAAPTWAWSNPLDEGYAPGYYSNNTQAEASGWNPYTALPYAQHAQLGVTGLATGVSN